MAGGQALEDVPETAVVLEPRPGSLLEGSLWHPDPSILTGEQALRVLADIGSARSFLAALEALAVDRVRQACEAEAAASTAVTEGRPVRFGGDVARALAVSEVAVAEGISEFAAARLLTAAESLCGPQLIVLDRLEAGVLSEAHAKVITEETAALPGAVAEEFGIQCLHRLDTRTGRRRSPAEFRKAVRALRERLHPTSIRDRKVRAERDRGVWVKPEPDGMCTLTAFLPAEVGLAAYNRVDRLGRARRADGTEDGRTLPQLRADELASLLIDASLPGKPNSPGAQSSPAGPSSPDGSGTDERLPTAEVVVHISVESLLGVTEEPAELEGYGSIDAVTARRLAAEAPTWQRLLVGGDGVALSLGRSAYRPPKALRRFIKYRDGTCQFPGCAIPAERVEIDHIVEWQHGGTTDCENLQSLCAKHHALKSLRLWEPTRLATSPDVLWTSRLGGRAIAGPVQREVRVQSTDHKVPDPPPF